MKIRHLLVVMNPHGGMRRGAAVLEQVRPVFVAAEITLDVHTTRHSGHAREIARTVSLKPYDAISAIGGDGTVHEIVGGLLHRMTPG